MPDSRVHISVDGIKYTGWLSLNISKSIETLTSSFQLRVADKDNQTSNADWLLQTQKECKIYIDDELGITGYIDSVNASISGDSHTIKISGRDKTADLVDCSYVETPRSFKKIKLLSLANTLLTPFGLIAKLGVNVTANDRFQFTVNTTDSVFKNLNKKAQDFGLLLITDAKSNLIIANSGDVTIDDSIEYGRNILSANVSYDYTDRFRDYTIQAQTLSKQVPGKWARNISVKGTASDSGIIRYRPKLIKNSSPLTSTGAQENAKWEALIHAAHSQTVSVTVQGFRDTNGNLWDVNRLISVDIPPLYINPALEMLITSVEFSLSDSGSTTKLSLKRSDAYTSKPYRKKSVKSVNKLGWDALKRGRA